MHVEVGAAARLLGRSCATLVLAGLLLASPRAWPAEEPASEPATPAMPTTTWVSSPTPDPLQAFSGGGDLSARAERAWLAGLQLGAPGFDPAARALLLDAAGGSVVERARSAAVAAPELPLAQAALAGALLGQQHDVTGGLLAVLHAIEALPRHREARLWLEATGFLVARSALFFGAFAFLAGVAALHARAAAHDLGDRVARVLPLFARAGLLGMLVLLPAILGQGIPGVALALFALALCYGGKAERRAAWAAVLLLVVGLELGTRGGARALVALDPDPVASAVQIVEHGMPSRTERARLEYAAGTDPLAARGLALQARREGRLGEAAQRYEALLSPGSTDPTLANNAANVWIALGRADRAVELYELATTLAAPPELLFNLSYGYGQAIRPRAQDQTLQRLQRVAPAFAFDLTQLQSKLAGGFTLDLPLPLDVLRTRAERSEAIPAVASELRRILAPGVLGGAPGVTIAALLAAALGARFAAGRFHRSSACLRCGGRLCPRCDGVVPAREVCTACQRLFERPETADPERRARRLAELEGRTRWLSRARLAASIVLPGAAGLLARRPWLGLAGSLALCAAFACAAYATLGVTDPLAAGGAGVLVFALAQLFCLGAYAGILVLALRGAAKVRA